ncbi:putative Ig domain-containing protein, partial [Flavobacterium kayseriense]
MKKKLHIYLTLIFLLTLSSTVFASHYRSGAITWREVSLQVVEFTVTTSWRSGAADNVFLNYGAAVTGVQETSNQIVSDVNGVATRVQKFVVTYPGLGPYTVSWSSCCRINGLSGGGSSGSMVLSTIVDLRGGNKNSPVCSLPATVNLPVGSSAATFQVPANDLDGDVLSYRLATVTELNGNQPAGFSINATTGLATVNTSLTNYMVGQLYMAGIIVSDGKTSVFVDFLIAITQPSTPPEFLYGPTPVNASVIVVSPGQNVNFQVSAQDLDVGGSISNLYATGIPGGASFPNASGNPATSTFNWTPTSNDFGAYVLNFVAQDNVGVQVFSSVTIQVSLKPSFDVPPTPAAGIHNVFTPGQIITFPVQVSDPDPVDVVRIVNVKGKDMMGQEIPLYSNASFSALPSLAANPTNGVFSWATQDSDWGHKHVYFWAEDSYGDRTRHEVNILINTNPFFTSTPPTATAKVAEAYSYEVMANDADIVYGDILSLYAIGAPSWLTLKDNGNGSGNLTGTPTLADVGTSTFKIEAHDINHHDNIGGIPFQVVSITVTANTSPIISVISNQSTCPNTTVTDLAFTVSDAETSAAILTVTAISSNTDLLPNGNILFGGSDALRTISLTPALGQSGTSTVVVTVDDGQGGREISTFTFTVEDKVAPVVVTKNITVQLNAVGTISILASEINNGSTDNCGIALVELDKTLFTCANLGANTVTLKVTDVNGNVTTKDATVTVEDKIAPIISIPGNITVDGSAESCGAIVDFVLPTASDNCGAGKNVLLIWDVLNSNTTSLMNSLTTAGFLVTLSATSETGYNGSNPSLDGFEAVIHLNGTTFSEGMTLDGQNALIDFVLNKGKMYITDEWSAYEVEQGTMREMSDIVVLNRTSGFDSNVTYTQVSQQLTHPILASVPSSFVLPRAGGNVGLARVYQSNQPIVLMTSLEGDAVAIRTFENGGKAVGFQHAGNYNNSTVLSDVNIQKLYVNAVNYGLGSAVPLNQTTGLKSGMIFPVGTTTNTFAAKDASGNQTVSSFTVTVQDKIAPVVLTKNITVQLNAAGTVSIVASDVNNGSTDACGIATMTLDKTD